MKAPAPAPPPPSVPRGARAGWLLGALVFLVAAGLPWSSCRNHSAVSGAIQFMLAMRVRDQLWGLATALPLVLVAAIAAMETPGRPYARPGGVLFGVTAATLASAGINTLSNRFVLYNWSGWPLLALRALLLLPPVAMAAWAWPRRERNATPLATRWITGHAALALPVAWSAILDRAGATLAFAAASALLLASSAVPDSPPAPLSERARRGLVFATAAGILAAIALAYLGKQRPVYLRFPPPRF